jgi:hypothetical protein
VSVATERPEPPRYRTAPDHFGSRVPCRRRFRRAEMAGLVGKIPAIPTLGAQGVTLRNVVYDFVMKRTSTYVGTIIVCAMVAENTVDAVVDTAWRTNNKGVRAR